MNREKFESTIRALKARRPFQVFTVELVSGERVEVDHSDAILVREGVALYAGPGGVPHIFDNEGVSQVIGDLSERPSD